MDSDSLISEIHSVFDRLEAITAKWSKSKADFSYSEAMKPVILAMEKAKSEQKTSAGREEEAYRSKEYTGYLWKHFSIECEYNSLCGQKGLLERKLDSLRSELSYEKEQVKRTV